MKIKSNEATQRTVGYGLDGTRHLTFTLKPGVENEVADEAWAAAKKLPVIQALLEEKALEEV